jgi:hypothetical protein
MPHHVPLRAGDPKRVGRYRLTGRLDGFPSDDPLFIGAGPDGTPVSLSLIGGNWARDGAARDRFAAEAAVAKRVPPFCAARVLDAGLDGDIAYLVSEYIRGQSLLEEVAEDGVRQGHELEALAIGMATGLASVHQAGLVHGSFGPQHVVVPPEGPPQVVEFGITPPYGSATPSADMFAWAQTVVFAATGHPPTAHRDLDFLPGRVREPVQQCLEMDSPERPAARAVLQFLLGEGSPRAGVLAEGSRRAARRSMAAGPVAAAVGAAAAPAAAPAAAGPSGGVPDDARPAGLDSSSAPHSEPMLAPARRHPADRGQTGSRHSAGGVVVRHHDRAQPGRARGRSPLTRSTHPVRWAIGAAAVVVLIVMALLIVHLVQGAGPSQRRPSAGTRNPASRPTQNVTSPSVSQSPTSSAAFAGTWSGPVSQGPVTYTVTITLASGQSSGSIAYTGADFSCSGNLSLTAATSTTMTMSQGIVVGQSTCSNGTVTIKLSGPAAISFSFPGNPPNPPAAGTLTRS